MKVLSVPEFCRIFKVSRRHAYDLVKEGAVRSIRLGRAVRVIIPDDWASEPVRAEEQRGEERRADR